ncbi:MAG: GTPase HflX [Chloroflexota bacterium]
MKGTVETRTATERAFLVSVATRDNTGGWSAEDSLEELAQLARTAEAEVVGRIIQHLPQPSGTHYLGKGKLTELLAQKDNLNFDVVIIDDELSPQQQHNLEEFLQVKIIDRVALILDIFARRARTREGQLQVELAQHEYLYPRLAGQWRHLERLGGGIGTRGPGESQLETDRRLLRQKIHRLKTQIEEVRKHRQLYRHQRQKRAVPVVAIVGYTNTGKSTLFNALSQAGVFVENRLFATLDPTTRRITLPDKRTVLLSDTVGFIRKLPPTIVTAFRATLEELAEANVLLHVVDMASHNASEQYQVVEETLADLDLGNKPRITVLNKIDLLLDKKQTWNEEQAMDYLAQQAVPVSENTVLVSATRKWGLQNLLEQVARILGRPEPFFTGSEK